MQNVVLTLLPETKTKTLKPKCSDIAGVKVFAWFCTWHLDDLFDVDPAYPWFIQEVVFAGSETSSSLFPKLFTLNQTLPLFLV